MPQPKHFMKIRSSPSFHSLDVDTICMVLSNDRLDVSSEMDSNIIRRIWREWWTWSGSHTWSQQLIEYHIEILILLRKDLMPRIFNRCTCLYELHSFSPIVLWRTNVMNINDIPFHFCMMYLFILYQFDIQ